MRAQLYYVYRTTNIKPNVDIFCYWRCIRFRSNYAVIVDPIIPYPLLARDRFLKSLQKTFLQKIFKYTTTNFRNRTLFSSVVFYKNEN